MILIHPLLDGQKLSQLYSLHIITFYQLTGAKLMIISMVVLSEGGRV